MIIAFVCGTLFGLALSGGFALLWVKTASKPKTVPVKQMTDDYEQRIATQWHNMAVYDGTERGQQELM